MALPTASDNAFPKIRTAEGTAWATPSSGFGVIYEKTDGLLYFKNDAGTEYDLTSAGTASASAVVFDEGSNKGTATAGFNFVGAGVSGTVTSGTAVITVPGEVFAAGTASTAAFSTSSTSYVDLTAMTVTATTGAHRCIVTFTGNVSNDTTNAWTAVALLIDGSNVNGGSHGWITVNSSGAANNIYNTSFTFVTDVLSAASHTFKLQMKVSSGTGKIREEGTYRLQVVETTLTT